MRDFVAGRAASPDFVAGRAVALRLGGLGARDGLLGACFSTGKRLTSMLRRPGLNPLTASESGSPIFT